MKTMTFLVILSVIVTMVISNPAPRVKRQEEMEGAMLAPYDFKDYCALKLSVDVSNITQAVTNGIPSGSYCEHYVLQCETLDGAVTRFVEKCGVGMWWSFEAETCQTPEFVTRLECHRAICPFYGTRIVADPRTCYAYYECQYGQAVYEFCEEGGFNPLTQTCEPMTTCQGLVPSTSQNGSSCTDADLPEVCPPGYIPSLIVCGCVHPDWEM